ncbi:MAG: hypothetical protein AAGA83_06910 [Cyanobacteria bacterium P01_F01_bin.116]
MNTNSQESKQKIRTLWLQRLAFGSVWLVFIYVVATKVATIRQIAKNPRIVSSLITVPVRYKEPGNTIIFNDREGSQSEEISATQDKTIKEWSISDKQLTSSPESKPVNVTKEGNHSDSETYPTPPESSLATRFLFFSPDHDRLFTVDTQTINDNFCPLELEPLYRQGMLSSNTHRELDKGKQADVTPKSITAQTLSAEEIQRIRIDFFYLLGALCLLAITGIASRRTRLTIGLPLLEELQLYLPEEHIAELHISKEDLKTSGTPELYIRLSVIQEHLELLWCNQVVIRIQNLWLPSSKSID